MNRIITTITAFVTLAISQIAFAFESFVVRNIEVVGLQRIKYSTVLNYMPVRVGEEINSDMTGGIIRDLYETGFFQHVQLERVANTLVIRVVERATIGSIDFVGSHSIPRDTLKEFFKTSGLVKNRVFRRSVLDHVLQSLTQEFNNRGKYNAKVTADVRHMSNNRVGIKIIISEGRVAKIKEVNIIGNKEFSNWRLRRQLDLTGSNVLSMVTKSDQYSQQRLDASLEALRTFYLNRGYIKFRVDSTQVLLSPDKKHVYINIKITEGPQYTFSGYDLAGRLVLPREELDKLVAIEKGDVFSRQITEQAVSNISKVLANRGYGFPNVNAEPKIDEENKTIFVTFVISPGRHYYVRRVNFTGNTKTAEYVLRHVMRQQEGGKMSLRKIKESERQLRVLSYIEDVNIKTTKVPGTNNQVDLDVSLKEAPSAEVMAQFNVSRVRNKFNPGTAVSFNQKNFMGTGKNVGLNFTANRIQQNYAFSYYDPFFNKENVGLGYNAYYQRLTPENLDISAFATNKFGGDVNINFLVNDRMSLQASAGFEHLKIRKLGDASIQLINFVRTNGDEFNQVRLSVGWNYNNYDQLPFPTKGVNQQFTGLLALPADSKSLEYYKVSYNFRGYVPLWYDFVFTAAANLAYGNQFNGKGLPFFENYYAGGIAVPGMVRGFDTYSLGPKDSRGNPLGGNVLAAGTVGLILPKPVSQGPFRTTLFLDMGNVYSDGLPANERAVNPLLPANAPGQGFSPGPLRFSTGVNVDWRSPFGPISISMGWPLKMFPGDKRNVPQFTMTSTF